MIEYKIGPIIYKSDDSIPKDEMHFVDQKGELVEIITNLGEDKINHPPHYTNHPSGIECIAVTEHMNFCLGNAIKYIWRANSKGNAVDDLKKAIWYLHREIDRIENIK